MKSVLCRSFESPEQLEPPRDRQLELMAKESSLSCKDIILGYSKSNEKTIKGIHFRNESIVNEELFIWTIAVKDSNLTST